ncbi:hypothetical protein FOL47_004796 [Perkinsus chesapeaki]|uniref:Oxidoreductase-like domain-containing protein n=1 Tax=Perkinsus chesapeaki TaxID=330153 RepID=A0A7J6M0P8_PERCH|nr:hypothetical protein FOL47_004796 [Perkinsus chesapeaki]
MAPLPSPMPPPPPEAPGPDDCCGSGCCPCIWDTYYDKVERWEVDNGCTLQEYYTAIKEQARAEQEEEEEVSKSEGRLMTARHAHDAIGLYWRLRMLFLLPPRMARSLAANAPMM